MRGEVGAVRKKPAATAKGRKGPFQWCTEPTRSKGNLSCGEHLRWLRRQLAWAYELKRLCMIQNVLDKQLLRKVLPHLQEVVDGQEVLVQVQCIDELNTKHKGGEGYQNSLALIGNVHTTPP